VARCFVTRELPGGALDRLAAEHEVRVWEEPLPPPREDASFNGRPVLPPVA
jgi:hypothetical protein